MKKREIPIYTINLPEYQVDKEPDHDKIGKKVDNFIKKYFINQHIVIRCLGSREHPRKTLDQLIDIIKKKGYDRYNPRRKGDRYQNKEGKKIDFFAFDYHINKKSKIFHIFTWPFYHWILERSGYAVRIDIILIYDPKKLNQVFFTYTGRENEGMRSDGFTFKYQKNKSDALLAIIKIIGDNKKTTTSKSKSLDVKKFIQNIKRGKNKKYVNELKEKGKN